MSDPYFDDVELLLHFDGANNSTTFIDESNAGRTSTINGTANITTSRAKFGQSLYLGTGSDISPTPSPLIGTQDFTIEFWIWSSASLEVGASWPDGGDPDQTKEAWRVLVYKESNNTTTFSFWPAGTASARYETTTTRDADTWSHVAFVRSGDNFYAFLNGVQLGTTKTGVGAVSLSERFFYIYSTNNGTESWIDDFRLTIGVARYTSNFTAPTEPFPGPAVEGNVASGFLATAFGTPLANPLNWMANGLDLSLGWVGTASTNASWSAGTHLSVSISPFGSASVLSPIIDIPSGMTQLPVTVQKSSSQVATWEFTLTNKSTNAVAWYFDTAQSTNNTDLTVNVPVSEGQYTLTIGGYLSDPGGTLRVMYVGLPALEIERIATGFLATTFGIPSKLDYRAQGFLATAFGTPILTSSYDAEGFLSPQFGTPWGASRLQAKALGPVARFGRPIAVGAVQLTQAVGFKAGGVGKPYLATTPEVVRNTVVRAQGFVAPQFGTPSSPVEQIGVARGLLASRFGAPRTGPSPVTKFGLHTSSVVMPAFGAAPSTAFGTPTSAFGCHAQGFRASQFGLPAATQAHVATGWGPCTRFGRPLGIKGGHTAYGFGRISRFGVPRLLTPTYLATGVSFAMFGTPTAQEIHLALHLPPDTRFGQPLMKRHT